MPLSDAAIRAAKSKNKPYKLADGKGLFLLVNPNGSKLWRFKYAYLGKEKSLSLGAYPAVGLKKARADSDAAREELASRKDPSFEKKKREIAETLSAATTFGTVAAEYIEKRSQEGVAAATTYMRWSPSSVQFGGLAKVGSGVFYAASWSSGLALSGASPE